MLGEHDQASGLRRLFHSAPPRVVGVVPCNAGLMPWVAQQVRVRASAGGSVLALDEWAAYGNLADCLRMPARFDLLQSIQNNIPLPACLTEVSPHLHVAAVARLASALGTERVLNQRILNMLKALQPAYREWLLVARPAEAMGFSALLAAVPSVIFVTEAKPEAVAVAYATLKQLAMYHPPMAATVVFAQGEQGQAQMLAANLHRVVRDQLHLSLRFATSLEQAMGNTVETGPEEFFKRLSWTASLSGRSAGTRGAGSAIPMSMDM